MQSHAIKRCKKIYHIKIYLSCKKKYYISNLCFNKKNKNCLSFMQHTLYMQRQHVYLKHLCRVEIYKIHDTHIQINKFK